MHLTRDLPPNFFFEPRPNSVTDRGSVQTTSLEMSAGSSPGLSTILAGQGIQLNRRSLNLSPVLQPSTVSEERVRIITPVAYLGFICGGRDLRFF